MKKLRRSKRKRGKTFFSVPRKNTAERKEFFSSLSHALKSPLVGASGYVEYLFKGYAGELSAEQIRQLGLARESILRLSGTINTLLNVVGFDLDLIKPSGECGDLAEQAKKIFHDMRKALGEKGIKMTVSVTDRELPVKIAEHWLQDLIYEITMSALSFSPKIKTARLAVEESGNCAQIIFTARAASAFKGKPGKMFSLFSVSPITFDRRNDRRGGMGLALAEHIVHSHGGDITAGCDKNIITITASLPLGGKKTRSVNHGPN
ncbi:MAG: HAMP domain-containing sensor histidine kinase [Elusimicrobiaceae bacterium]